jgi:raffinose/stachyose/melibiose transport system permease protein
VYGLDDRISYPQSGGIVKSSARVKNNKKWRQITKGYMFLAPILIIMGIFKFIPLLTALVMSFFNWNGTNLRTYVGLANFKELLVDETFIVALKNMVIYTLGNVGIQLTLPLLAALLVFHVIHKRLQNFLKVLFVFPLIVPTVVIYLSWQWIYAGDYGALNEFFKLIGLESWTRAWLGESGTAIWSVIFVNFPWIGGITFLIYLAGLLSISNEMFELSKLEGMNPWQRLVHIELPLIKSQLKLIIMLTIIQQIQSFENVLLLTNGGPGTATLTPALFMYNEGFAFNRMGYASAAGFMLFIVVLLVTWINNHYMKDTEKLD